MDIRLGDRLGTSFRHTQLRGDTRLDPESNGQISPDLGRSQDSPVQTESDAVEKDNLNTFACCHHYKTLNKWTWTDGWMDGWTDGWIHNSISIQEFRGVAAFHTFTLLNKYLSPKKGMVE